MVPVIILACSPFVFSGGGPGDLVAAIAQFNDRPAAIMLDVPNQSYRAATVEIDPADERASFLKGVRGQFGLSALDECLDGYSIGAWPLVHFYAGRSLPDQSSFDFLPVGSVTLRNGVVSLTTKGNEAVTVGNLARAAFIRPLATHWFYARLPIAVHATEAKEEDFFECIAAAIGADLIEANDGYSFEFNAAEFRRRAVLLLSEEAKKESNSFLAATMRFRVEAMLFIDDEQLRKCYETEVSEVLLEVPPAFPVWKAAVERLDAFLEVPAHQPDYAATLESRKRLVDQIDLERPFEIIYGSTRNHNEVHSQRWTPQDQHLIALTSCNLRHDDHRQRLQVRRLARRRPPEVPAECLCPLIPPRSGASGCTSRPPAP